VTASPRSSVRVKSGAGSPSRKSAKSSASSKRAVGVVRVSRVGDRSGEQFVSPSEQAQRIRSACSRDGLKLVETIEELDVSGGTPLASRHGLRRAVELVEAGEVDVIAAAYFDRLVRSLSVQAELVSRVEQAGGAILAVDVGQVTHGSSAQWLSASMLGAVSEYARRATAERTQDAKRRAVAQGVPPFPNVPPGYRRDDDGRLERHPKEAAAIKSAFKLRAKGGTVMEVRQHLRKRGIERSFHGTTSLLGSRIYLGELRFGEMVNLESHTPLVDAETWAAVQRMRTPRGRRAKSERLLARLGVLRCGTCGARMVVGTANHGNYNLYRCPPNADCPQRVTISAEVAEQTVVDAVQELLEGMKGTASISDSAQQAERGFEKAEAELSAAVDAFTGLDDVAAARTRLLELRDQRDEARERLDELQAAAAPAITVTADDWDMLTLDEQRALIRAVVAEASVAPGRGNDRITVTPR
jgi:site-specific DNA recombinase